jgi:purine-binding chemotaxis protein CheW
MSGSNRLDFEQARKRMERALASIESTAASPAELESVYRQRAEWLARPLDSGEDETAGQIVIFRLDNARYALPLNSVVEVIARPRITPTPGAPPEVAGLIQVRGEVRVVWNLQRILGLPSSHESGANPAALLLRLAGGEPGVLVDEVEDIRAVPDKQRCPEPQDSVMSAWMTADLVTVLSVDALFPGDIQLES